MDFYEYLLLESRKTKYSNEALQEIRKLSREDLSDEELIDAIKKNNILNKYDQNEVFDRIVNSIKVKPSYKETESNKFEKKANDFIDPINANETKDGNAFIKSVRIDNNRYKFISFFQKGKNGDPDELPSHIIIYDANGEHYTPIFRINLEKKEVVKLDTGSHRVSSNGKINLVREPREFLSLCLRKISNKIREKDKAVDIEINKLLNNKEENEKSFEEIDKKFHKKKDAFSSVEKGDKDFDKKQAEFNSELTEYEKSKSIFDEKQQKLDAEIEKLKTKKHYKYGEIKYNDIKDSFNESEENNTFKRQSVHGTVKSFIYELSNLGLHDALFYGKTQETNLKQKGNSKIIDSEAETCNKDGSNIDSVFEQNKIVQNIILTFIKNHTNIDLSTTQAQNQIRAHSDSKDLSIVNKSRVYQIIDRTEYLTDEQKIELKKNIKKVTGSDEITIDPYIYKAILNEYSKDNSIRTNKEKMVSLLRNSYKYDDIIKIINSSKAIIDKFNKTENPSVAEKNEKNKAESALEEAEFDKNNIDRKISNYIERLYNEDGTLDLDSLNSFKNKSIEWQRNVLFPFVQYLIKNIVISHDPKTDEKGKENLAFAIDKTDDIFNKEDKEEESKPDTSVRDNKFKEVVKKIITNYAKNKQSIDPETLTKEALDYWNKNYEISTISSNDSKVTDKQTKDTLKKEFQNVGYINLTYAQGLVNEVIDDDLDYSKIKNGNFDLGYGEFSYEEVDKLTDAFSNENKLIRYMYSGNPLGTGKTEKDKENINYYKLINADENTNWYSLVSTDENTNLKSSYSIVSSILNNLDNKKVDKKEENTKEE